MDSPPSSSSQATSSSTSSRPSASSHPSTSSTSSHRSDLPNPPPSSRLPPPKGRSTGANGFRVKLGGKGKERKLDGQPVLDEEEWTLEGLNGDRIRERESLDLERPMMVPGNEGSVYDSQVTERPEKVVKKPDKDSKSRRLVKKTSQLFGRKEKVRQTSSSREGQSNNDSLSNLSIPSTSSRQASFSSVTSGESSTSTTNARNPLYRPLSHQSRQSAQQPSSWSPKMKHARRISQDSQLSWYGLARNSRSGSSSTESPPLDPNLPATNRQVSNLSASLPALSRSSMPPIGQQTGVSIPSRMSTWFSHLITSTPPEPPTSSNDPSSSPARKPTSAAASFLNAARQRAVDGVRHLLDTEAQPDRCTEVIWVMGIPHPGYRPPSPSRSPSPLFTELPESSQLPDVIRRDSGSSGKPSPPRANEGLKPASWGRKKDMGGIGPTSPPNKGVGQFFSQSTLPLVTGSPSKDSTSSSMTDSPSKAKKGVSGPKEKEVLRWPEAFYDDFRSRIWCTYRSQYAPILSLPNNLLIPSPSAYYGAFDPPADIAPPPLSSSNPSAQPTLSSKPSSWGWSRSADERGLTSDAGWGCMLRTGQSMLANALIYLHLGRDWRVPLEKPWVDTPNPDLQAIKDYANYIRILSYFLDDPSPLCPFSVHRMALIGKELGKEVGEWFGPSTAAGALRTLANSFPLCGVAVATATDSIIYRSDVYSASHLPSKGWDLSESKNAGLAKNEKRMSRRGRWGNKAVLILIGIRLGLDGVNPIYHESVKNLFTFPQSVGIAGGRPSSSYYFVASQANSLFYLDPHFTKPAIPLEIPPSVSTAAPALQSPAPATAMKDDPDLRDSIIIEKTTSRSGHTPDSYQLDVVDVDDISGDSDASLSPSERRGRKVKRLAANRRTPTQSPTPAPRNPSTPSTPVAFRSTAPVPTVSDVFTVPAGRKDSDLKDEVDPQSLWYLRAYSETQLRTFHSEKVRKMPLSGLDPSMLLGFLCRDEADFEDFCERVNKLPQKIFSVQAEPPSWDDDDAAGLESVSEPELSEEEEESLRGLPTVMGLDDASPGVESSTTRGRSTARAVDLEEDADWDTPSLATLSVIDRTSTPSSIPVMVERPKADMPKNAIPASETIKASRLSGLVVDANPIRSAELRDTESANGPSIQADEPETPSSSGVLERGDAGSLSSPGRSVDA